MGNLAQSGNAYGLAMRATGSPRNVEYQVFSQITGRLSGALGENVPFATLAAALQDNVSLWSIVAEDVAREENELPRDLRGQLFYLAEFTTHHTRKVLKGEADAQALIDVNKSVMRGLHAHPAEVAPCPA